MCLHNVSRRIEWALNFSRADCYAVISVIALSHKGRCERSHGAFTVTIAIHRTFVGVTCAAVPQPSALRIRVFRADVDDGVMVAGTPSRALVRS